MYELPSNFKNLDRAERRAIISQLAQMNADATGDAIYTEIAQRHSAEAAQGTNTKQCATLRYMRQRNVQTALGVAVPTMGAN